VELTKELAARGIPRSKTMGFEYDGWTQITKAGYYNDPRIENLRLQYVPPRPLPFKPNTFFGNAHQS
jgi:hypothetical protein